MESPGRLFRYVAELKRGELVDRVPGLCREVGGEWNSKGP